jgi:plastocyanin
MYKAKFFFLTTSSIVVASILVIGLVSNLPLVFALIFAQQLGSSPAEAAVTITLGAADDGNFEPYTPSTVNIMSGNTVSWTNDDSTEHAIISNEMPLFDSGPISPGDTFDNTFDSPGEFGYHCSIHPWMTGRVMVG